MTFAKRPFMWHLMDAYQRTQYYMSYGLQDAEIAKRVGVHRVTVSRWKKEFRDSLFALEKKLNTKGRGEKL